MAEIRTRAAADVAPSPELAHFHPVLAKIYQQRGIQSAKELDLNLSSLPTWKQLHDIHRAVEVLTHALINEWVIVIAGDYDCDGATSTALAVSVLRQMGAYFVTFVVPDRLTMGYGLTPLLVEHALAQIPTEHTERGRLLITVDNGIVAYAGVDAAKNAGFAVLVTDHHLPGANLPSADAIVNPNQPDCPFPSKAMAGVGVMFYVLTALRAKLRELGWTHYPNLADHLDLVALGTVADVVPLDRINRTLVHHGLQRMRHGRLRYGLAALIQVAGRKQAELSATDLGFAVGPRLNAAGRIADMALGIKCLLAENEVDAKLLAQQLDSLNRERRELQNTMQDQAFAQIEADLATFNHNINQLEYGLVVKNTEWHEGVIGLVASQLKEKYHRPVIAFTAAHDPNYIKGSGRSVPNFHIRDAIAYINAQHPDMMDKFGGHAMAAGLTIHSEYFEVFQTAFEAEARKFLSKEDVAGIILTDGMLEPDQMDLHLADILKNGGPWGQNFAEPLFEGNFLFHTARLLKEKHWRLSLQPIDSQGLLGEVITGLYFNQPDWEPPTAPDSELYLAYQLEINKFNNKTELQLLIRHINN